jgi:hypothetical protein
LSVYLVLKLLGERHIKPPPLGQHVRRVYERRKDEPDYTI